MREALFSLARIERELISEAIQSRLLDVMEKVMLAKPIYWEKYYLGSKDEQQILRRYSYSDRIRYYWNQPEVEQSVQQLLTNFATNSIPETILSQYLPQQYDAIRAGEITANAEQIIRHKIRAAIRPYSSACLGHLPLR
jgi:D-tagatose-1,6-bisphosphate aldolase subunit GatZ/KbaZ